MWAYGLNGCECKSDEPSTARMRYMDARLPTPHVRDLDRDAHSLHVTSNTTLISLSMIEDILCASLNKTMGLCA